VTDVEAYKLSLYETIEIIKESEDAVVELVRNTLEDRKYIKISYHSDKREVFSKLKEISSGCLPRIIDIFWSDDTIVIEEYIEGTNLATLIEDNRITGRIADAIVDDILSAVGELHKAQIVHRDIKPANIIITTDNRAVLVDFGIARIFSPNLQKDSSSYGTVGYAAPEQYGFSQSDYKSDIYAIGITFKELASVAKISHIDGIIKRCIEFDPNKRPESIDKIRQSLKSRKRIPIILVAAVAFLGVLVGVWFVTQAVNLDKIKADGYMEASNAVESSQAGVTPEAEGTPKPEGDSLSDSNTDTVVNEVVFTKSTLMDIDKSVKNYKCVALAKDSTLNFDLDLGQGNPISVQASFRGDTVSISINGLLNENLTFDRSISSGSYENTDLVSEIVIYDFDRDGIMEVMPIIGDVRMTDEAIPTRLSNGMMAWCIYYDGVGHLAEGNIITDYHAISLYADTPGEIWGEFPDVYRLEGGKLVKYEF